MHPGNVVAFLFFVSLCFAPLMALVGVVLWHWRSPADNKPTLLKGLGVGALATLLIMCAEFGVFTLAFVVAETVYGPAPEMDENGYEIIPDG